MNIFAIASAGERWWDQKCISELELMASNLGYGLDAKSKNLTSTIFEGKNHRLTFLEQVSWTNIKSQTILGLSKQNFVAFANSAYNSILHLLV